MADILKNLCNTGRRADFRFYRDSHGNEVDLLIPQGRKLIPIEIKSARTFTPEFAQGIHRFRELVGDRVGAGFVLYDGEQESEVRGVRAINPLRSETYTPLPPLR